MQGHPRSGPDSGEIQEDIGGARSKALALAVCPSLEAAFQSNQQQKPQAITRDQVKTH